MRVVLDTNVLLYLLEPHAKAPEGAQHCGKRIAALLKRIEQDGGVVLIPTPVLAELLVRVEHRENAVQALTSFGCVRIVDFDKLAAIECATRAAERQASGNKQKAKFDEQIVAIAIVHRAAIIYSDDVQLKKIAGDAVQVIGIAELPYEADLLDMCV